MAMLNNQMVYYGIGHLLILGDLPGGTNVMIQDMRRYIFGLDHDLSMFPKIQW